MAMAKARTPRDAWLRTGLQALADGGPDAVRVEALAASLGVSKGGFYWHFKDRRALLEEMLDGWEKVMVEDVIAQIERQPAKPREKLRQLFALASTVDFRVELAIRDWARRDGEVEARVRRIDNRRMDYMRRLFGQLGLDEEEAEVRALLAFSLFVGSYFIAADHTGKSRSQVLGIALERLYA
jgi:AcrR family transcriptional regulator